MPIKKSAIFMVALSFSSVGLLVVSSAIAPPAPVMPAIPVKCTRLKCCSQLSEGKTFSPWGMISQIMLRSAV